MSAEPTLPVSQPEDCGIKDCHVCEEESLRAQLAVRDRGLQQVRGERDSLLAECQKLQDIIRAGDAESETVQSALREAREEVARLKEALTKYGLHRWNCKKQDSPRPQKVECTCGFSEALHPVPEKPKTKG